MSAPNDQFEQDLSCLMDGELTDNEARFLLRRLEHDQSLQDCWARWHAARSGWQPDEAGNGCRLDINGLAARVSEAVAAEPAPQLSSPPVVDATSGPRWLKPVAGLGLAAAVAALAINLLPQSGLPNAPGIPADSVAALADNSLPSDSATPVVDESSNFGVTNRVRAASSGVTRAMDPQLQEYLIRHNQVSTSRRGKGLVPYIYVLTPTTRVPAEETQTDSAATAPPEDLDTSSVAQ